jgi:hypothetical protein
MAWAANLFTAERPPKETGENKRSYLIAQNYIALPKVSSF